MATKTINTVDDIPNNTSLCIFGAGEIGISLFLTLRKSRPDIQIVCFVDTYKRGTRDGVEIISPDELPAYAFNHIIIASINYQTDIIALLRSMGIQNYLLLNPIFDSVSTRILNRLDKSSCDDVLYAFYDRAVYPDGFDVINFLFFAEVTRKQMGCSHVHPVFVPVPDDHYLRKDEKITYGRDNVRTVARDNATSQWWERNIMIPCCWMLPSCRQVSICTTREEAALLYSRIASKIFPADYSVESPTKWSPLFFSYAASQYVQDIPSLRATDKAKEYVDLWIAEHLPEEKKIIAITLRESPFQNDRNSKVGEWVSFAKRLDTERYCPVIIRDTSVALRKPPPQLTHFPIFQECSWNMELRMAFYERSYINLFTAGGPAILAFANKAVRTIIFHVLREGVFECSREHMEADGLMVGKDFFGATPYQHNIWEDESVEIIEREFHRLVEKIETG